MIHNSKLILGLLLGIVFFASGLGYVNASNNTMIVSSPSSNNTGIASSSGVFVCPWPCLSWPPHVDVGGNTLPGVYLFYGKDYAVHTDVTSQQLKDVRSLRALQINWALGNLTLGNFTSPAYKTELLNETKYLGDLFQYDESYDAKLTLQELENKTTLWVIPSSQAPLILMEKNLLNSTEAASSSSNSATVRELSPIVYYSPISWSDALLEYSAYLATIVGLVIAIIALGIFLAYNLHKLKVKI